MHIVLGAIGSIVTILWLLYRLADMGIDLGGLNPWLWRRRRKWKQTYEANPIYSLTSPMEVTALLITAIAKADGDMSLEEKREILGMFEKEFHLSTREATELLASSTHLLGKGEELRENLAAIMAPSLDAFTPEQAESAIDLFGRIGAVGGEATEIQAKLIDEIGAVLNQKLKPAGKWS